MTPLKQWSSQRRPEGAGHTDEAKVEWAWLRAETEQSRTKAQWEWRGRSMVKLRRAQPYLDHAVTVGVGDVGL